MKLYGSDLSPFAARCRMQFLAKGLDIPMEPAPDGLKSDTFTRINPLQRIPALVLDSGRALPESIVICEYIEDLYPEPPLRPADPEQRAIMRTLSRIVDLYFLDTLGPLFGQMDPASRDQAVVDDALAKAGKALDGLEHYIGEGGFAVGDSLSLADCTLVASFTLTLPFLGRFGGDPLQGRPKLAAYWQAIQQNDAAKTTIERMQADLAKARAEGRVRRR